MEPSKDKVESPKRKYSIIIQVISTIFSLFYILFFILSFIPSPKGSPISDHPYSPWDIEMITVKLLFILFMIGFYYSWKNKMIAGVIYLVWCVALFCQEIYISKLLNIAGDGVMFIPPILIISIILIISGLIDKRKTKIGNR